MTSNLDPFVYLCNTVFGPNRPVDIDLLSKEECVFFLVEHTRGIVTNAGFADYLQSETPGDNNYTRSLEAYFSIGAESAYRVYSEAVEIGLRARFCWSTESFEVRFSFAESCRLRELDLIFEAVQDEIDDRLKNWLARFAEKMRTQPQ